MGMELNMKDKSYQPSNVEIIVNMPTDEAENQRASVMLANPHVSEVFGKALEAMKNGLVIYYKWTCGNCHQRATADEVDSLYESYHHQDCGFTTMTVDGDLGFLAVASITKGTGEN